MGQMWRHIQSALAIGIANSLIALGPDKQWQAYQAEHLWAHLAFVVAVNAWAAIVPYLRSTKQSSKNPTLPVEPAKE